MKNLEKEESNEIIEIPEEVSIPGTNIILEEGDKIQIVNEGSYQLYNNFEVEKLIQKVGYDEIFGTLILDMEKTYKDSSMSEIAAELRQVYSSYIEIKMRMADRVY